LIDTKSIRSHQLVDTGTRKTETGTKKQMVSIDLYFFIIKIWFAIFSESTYSVNPPENEQWGAIIIVNS